MKKPYQDIIGSVARPTYEKHWHVVTDTRLGDDGRAYATLSNGKTYPINGEPYTRYIRVGKEIVQ